MRNSSPRRDFRISWPLPDDRPAGCEIRRLAETFASALAVDPLGLLGRDDLAQARAGEAVVTAVEVPLDAGLLAVRATGEVAVLVLVADDALVPLEGEQDVLQNPLG